MSHGPAAIVSLIVPALNEAPAIGAALDAIPPQLFAEVLVVDNGSTDDTAAIAVARGATVVTEPRRGYGYACLAGIAKLRPDCSIVMFMDADSADDPSDAVALLDPILRGEADMVIGVRRGDRVAPGSLASHQRWGNRLATWLIRQLYRTDCTDLGPFRAIRRDALQMLAMRDPTFGWTVEMQAKAFRRGLRVVEVPVAYRPRVGVSKVSGNFKNSVLAGVKIIWTIVRLRV